jgi:hypothetical protein
MNPVSAILKPREVAAATYASAAGCVQEIGPEQAFIGKLSAGRFSPERIGTDQYSNAEVRSKCQERGVPI